MAFFFKHLNLSGTTHNRLYREDNLEIPYDALREAVVNAYCHMQWGYEIATVGIAIYDDCIVIENAGRFPVRISPNTLMRKEEEDRKNTSMPPNPVIANVMYLAGLIEHWGRGLSMMARQCEGAGLPAPEFYCDGTVVKITFMRPKDTGKDTVGVSKDTVGHSTDTVGHSSILLNNMPISKSIRILIQSIGEDWFTANMLCEIIGLSSKSSFIRNYIRPAMNCGLVALENPDSTNAPNQRYGLTLKGKALYYERLNNENDVQNDLQRIKVDPQTDLEGQNDLQIVEDGPQKHAVIRAIKENNGISRAELARIAGCSESTIKRRMKEWNIAWLGHPKTGHWVFVKDIQ